MYPGELDSEMSESWFSLLQRELPVSNLKEEAGREPLRPVMVEVCPDGRKEMEEEQPGGVG